LPEAPCRAIAALLAERVTADDRVCGSPGLQGQERVSAAPPLLSPTLWTAAEATLPRADAALTRRKHGPRHASASGRFRLRGEDPVDCAAPWPFAAALRDLGARRRALASEDGSSRTLDRSARVNFRSRVRDPPDLGADLLGVPGPATQPQSWVSSHGVVQRSPLRRSSRGVGLPGASGFGVSTGSGVSTGPRAPFGMGKPLPIRLPSSWFLTTSTGCSSSTLRPYCRPLPILGFTAFPSVAKRNSPRCSCRPPKLSLRRQLRSSETNRGLTWARITAPTVSGRAFTANLAPSPFSPSSLGDRSFLRRFGREPGPRGLAPSSGPLPVRPFQDERARCSPGLG